MDIVLTLPLLFLMTVIFMTLLVAPHGRDPSVGERSGYRMLSMTTSTSQGRSVPSFFGSFGFLFFILSPRVAALTKLSAAVSRITRSPWRPRPPRARA